MNTAILEEITMTAGERQGRSIPKAPSRSGGTSFTASLPRGAGIGWFGTAALVNAIGTGFFYPYQLLFFLGVTELRLTTIGAGLTAATLLALPAVLLLGRWVDRFGTRASLVAAALVRAAVFVAYLFIHDVASFIALAFVAAVAQRAEQVAMPVLASGIAPEGQLGSWLALTKVAFNAGMGCGGLLAGLALVQTSSHAGFVTVGLLNAASFALTALLYLPLPTIRASAAGRSFSGSRPWRDPLFVRIATVNFLLITVIVATEVGLPVYLIDELDTPAWTVGLLFAMNTILMVVFQLPVSSRLRSRAPLRVIAVGSVLHAALLIVLGLAGQLPFAALLPLLVMAVMIYTLGEIVATQVLSVLLVTLAPDHERGVYQAFNQVLVGLSLAVVPLLVALFLTHAPAGLWWMLSAVTVIVLVGMLRMDRRSGAAIAVATGEGGSR
ncbi:MFS transporter [Streptomyces sp. NPDC057445]|uniref:MFS transporter n=1 Tax=Streptomyces sp. NPDC057445 TaxID=3346136 RepID=UPI003677C79A